MDLGNFYFYMSGKCHIRSEMDEDIITVYYVQRQFIFICVSDLALTVNLSCRLSLTQRSCKAGCGVTGTFVVPLTNVDFVVLETKDVSTCLSVKYLGCSTK